MSLKRAKNKKISKVLIYSVITIIILSALLVSAAMQIENNTLNQAREQLHMETKQIKEDITLQINSDRENLHTIASFASTLHKEGKDFRIVFDSFESIGLIEKLVIMLPDGTCISRKGRFTPDNGMTFEDELKKGEYTSGRVPSFAPPKRNVVRNAVHIKHDGEVVGILYGITELQELQNRYASIVNDLNAQLYIYDGKTGDFIVDTFHNKNLDNINELKDYEFKEGYSFEQMMSQDRGNTSVMSKSLGQYLHMHYSPIENVGNWNIMLARKEEDVFENSNKIFNIVFGVSVQMITIMLLFLLTIYNNEKKKGTISAYSSNIRKMLLNVNTESENIRSALEQVAKISKARSAFLVDTDGEDHNYILPQYINARLDGDKRTYLISQLISYSVKYSTDERMLSVMFIKTNSRLKKNNKKLYDMLIKHNIKSIEFTAVKTQENYITILATTNSKRPRDAAKILSDISVCFSIAIFNKKHLNKTEIAASTDSLTGLLNRVSYNNHISDHNDEQPENFACIYIDVNELHVINNKYGHAAGDEMLVYIANTIKEVFFGHSIYRYGGDEFIVFAKDTNVDYIKYSIESLKNVLTEMNYHVAVGYSFRTKCTNIDEIIRDAEVRMYEEKARYYQKKESSASKKSDDSVVITSTGIKEVDTLINLLADRYYGIYRVSLNKDTAHRIIMPAYFDYNEQEEGFKQILKKYIDNMVNPDFHRSLLTFLNFDALKKEMSDGITPRITYKKSDGNTVLLSIYNLGTNNNDIDDTMWIFEKFTQGE